MLPRDPRMISRRIDIALATNRGQRGVLPRLYVQKGHTAGLFASAAWSCPAEGLPSWLIFVFYELI